MCRWHHFAMASERLRDLGFDLADRLELELQTPGRVASLVDREEDCRDLVQSLDVSLEAVPGSEETSEVRRLGATYGDGQLWGLG